MSEWDWEEWQREFRNHANRKAQDADDCRRKAAKGNVSYERFHDAELAEHIVASHLSTTAALMSRDALIRELRGYRESVASGSNLYAAGTYRAADFRRQAIRYLDMLLKRLEDDPGSTMQES